LLLPLVLRLQLLLLVHVCALLCAGREERVWSGLFQGLLQGAAGVPSW
jgi:hypothetical protein